jgi:ABC-type glycerol-3-phosphate transport system permease component
MIDGLSRLGAFVRVVIPIVYNFSVDRFIAGFTVGAIR